VTASLRQRPPRWPFDCTPATPVKVPGDALTLSKPAWIGSFVGASLEDDGGCDGLKPERGQGRKSELAGVWSVMRSGELTLVRKWVTQRALLRLSY
jgi:hypothetical protein